jgi:hypothetical protein
LKVLFGLIDVIKQWQTLIAALIAIAAVIIAWKNATRAIDNSNLQEKHRRERKFAALRAVLPLALSSICDYAESTSACLLDLHRQCVQGGLPKRDVVSWPESRPRLPDETVDAISEFVEYSDEVEVDLFEQMLSRVQVLNARLRKLFEGSRRWQSRSAGSQHNIEEYILDCARIYAAAAAAFEYARKEKSDLPKSVGWEQITSSLNSMGLWEHELPQVHQMIQRRSERGVAP